MFAGDSEVHLTGSAQEVDGLAAFAARRGAKFTHILLDRGDTPSRPVLRVKIETAPGNEGCPRPTWRPSRQR